MPPMPERNGCGQPAKSCTDDDNIQLQFCNHVGGWGFETRAMVDELVRCCECPSIIDILQRSAHESLMPEYRYVLTAVALMSRAY